MISLSVFRFGLFAFFLLGASHQRCSADTVTWAKLLVREDQMYAVRANTIEAHNPGFIGTASAHINLYHTGDVVPIALDGLDHDGRTTHNTTITFWGEAPRGEDTPKNPHTRENAYILRWNDERSPARFAPATWATAGSSVAMTSWRRTRRLEQDDILAHYQHYTGRATDRAMWKSLSAPPRENPENNLHFDLPDLLENDSALARISLLLWGTSTLPQEPDHRWRVFLNGMDVGIAEWDGNASLLFTTSDFAQKQLRRESNEMSFVSLHSGTTIDAALVDWIDITYDARLDVDEASLEFVPSSPFVRVGGCADPEEWMAFTKSGDKLAIRLADGALEVSIPAVNENTPVRLARLSTLPEPERIAGGREIHLPTPDESPEYLIVAHTTFIDALRPLLDHRRVQGLRAALVNVEDLYDTYTHGQFSPNAMRLFLLSFLEDITANAPALKYVLFVGDASYDYFALRGKDENFVPTWHATLEDKIDLPDYSPTMALEDAFVYPKSGPLIPLAAVGRLPAHSPETVRAYVAKVLDYETQQEPERLRSLFIASHGFEQFLDRIELTDFARGWQSYYLHGTGAKEDDLLLPGRVCKAFSDGLDVVYFVGHGAYYMWRTGINAAKHNYDVLTSKEVPLLDNRGRYPIVFAATCFSTLFDAPMHHKSYSDSGVGVHLVEAPEAGAIAIIGQLSKTPVGAADMFARDTITALMNPEVERLGDAFLWTKQHSQLRNDPHYRGVVLIGDPALYVGQRFRKGDS